MKEKINYCGFNQDSHGITLLGRVVLDAWLFELLPRSEDCSGWDLTRMQMLSDRVQASWEPHAHLPSRLPAPLQQRHRELYAWATERARQRGWNPELADDE
ncbi:hypothetical protein [Hydrogenophaga sp.]|uniref:hypothetical protein n=1 Tax=Hydrogenophaga sp. TaxID=1904254 RepID=UPI0019C29887|nr:hypothetical protein [Hydrogenophaga sp.]MBD3892364.1 hypothetical protein [Hydrogenophaga sp.]